jgi:xylan 1,4-beta-xylosidase
LKVFKNPILPGFYPDPSICRVGDDYYLVTSTFAYFPGIPIFRSKDLVNWEQIGHVLDRASQLNLDGVGHSEGIFAPVIRYYKGIFYVITTNVSGNGNFIVTTTDPAGEWSEPYWLEDANGIDPLLFFDDNGHAYYTGTRPVPEGEVYFGNYEIWLQELDLNHMKLIGEKYSLWRGAMRDVIWPEGPHLYKINNLYYLMISEGGTDYYHSVTIARSNCIIGPYEGNPGNPILTHRHLGRAYPIVNTGHADLVETKNGQWWMVALASRPYGGYYRNLGRETFLVPVRFENGWPIVSPGTGHIDFTYKCPDLPSYPKATEVTRDDFLENKLNDVWNCIRTPREQFWDLNKKAGYLRLKLRAETINEEVNPSFIGRRQQHKNFEVCTSMEFSPINENESAGIVLIQNNKFNFQFVYTMNDQQYVIQLKRCFQGKNELLAEKSFFSECIYLKVTAKGQDYNFYYGSDIRNLKTLIEKVDGRILSTDIAGGFVGTYIGMYASGNGKCSENTANFDWFDYLGQED